LTDRSRQDLISELKSELSGNFEQVILALFMTPSEYDAQELRSAMKVGHWLLSCDNNISNNNKLIN